MTKELDEKLVATFPKLFRDRHGDPRETCMCQGFDCDDGWFDIIWKLASEIEVINDSLADEDLIRAVQVKEKFGGLRFYVSSYPKNVDELITEAQIKSMETCEICGEPGAMAMPNGWYKTRCQKHSEVK